MRKIEIYTRPGCGYCVSAKRLLSYKGHDFTEYDTARDQERFREMLGRTSHRTLPQIFIDDQSIGGFDDLLRLEEQSTTTTVSH